MNFQTLVNRLEQGEILTAAEWLLLITREDTEGVLYLQERARALARARFGMGVYVRGLIEVSNYCRNNCYYCGIRAANRDVQRYRLSFDTILACCESGYALGFRTFVLQGGEDPKQTDDFMVEVVQAIRAAYPDCAITLSLGEKSREAYQRFFEAGANRYLLRHETYHEAHYRILHPPHMSLAHRLQCLYHLQEIGYQVGTGIMVGSPGQTAADIVADMQFMQRLSPQMIGIGPFLPHHATPFAAEKPGSLSLTLRLLSLLRVMHPSALIPATTALATLSPEGRNLGILAGANVVMPNLSPTAQRKNYSLYDDKAALGAESAEGLALLQEELQSIGYHIDYGRGDFYKESCI